jgi:glycosyltransferase 2 family protein
MKKKVFVGVALSALLVYLSIRGIDFKDVADGFRTIDYGYLLPALALLFVMQVLRSVRWGIILRPLAKIDQLSLFSVTSVGFLAIVAIPARLGELARPHLITKKSNIKMSSALGTIIVERVFDSLTVLVIAAFALFFIPLPPWLIRASGLFFLATLALFALTILMVVKREASLRALAALTRKLPPRLAEAVDRLIGHFIEGLGIMVDPGLLISVTGLSFSIWLVDVLAIYLLFLAFGFDLPVAAAFILMVILIIGIAIPTAPGFVGNWHYSCVLGLSLFGVPRAEALTFAIIYHALSIALVAVLGAAFLPFNRFSFADLRKQMRS